MNRGVFLKLLACVPFVRVPEPREEEPGVCSTCGGSGRLVVMRAGGGGVGYASGHLPALTTTYEEHPCPYCQGEAYLWSVAQDSENWDYGPEREASRERHARYIKELS